jgi:hypothetical protein
MSDVPPLRPLDQALTPLRDKASGPLPLFGPGTRATDLAPGLMFHADPAGTIAGQWSSPAGRLIEISADITTPGKWFALHVTIPLPDLTGLTWIGLILRSSAARSCVIWPCLRSGLEGGGFRDDFFARHILAQSRESDHHDILATPWHPDLPAQAPWREIILFLPSAEGFRLVIHDLRILAL